MPVIAQRKLPRRRATLEEVLWPPIELPPFVSGRGLLLRREKKKKRKKEGPRRWLYRNLGRGNGCECERGLGVIHWAVGSRQRVNGKSGCGSLGNYSIPVYI